jgi:hypothetical protein
MTQPPYVKSNYPRIPGDYYPTIDPRCVYALLQHIEIKKSHTVFDVCAPQGSGIINTLKATGWENAFCKPDAFEDLIMCDLIVTNPPFTRPLVDMIIERQIERVRHNQVSLFACLLRANFDFAKSRQTIFKDELYFGQIKMTFRPYWSEERKSAPIHNFVWHIWANSSKKFPVVFYADGELHSSDEKRFTAKKEDQHE